MPPSGQKIYAVVREAQAGRRDRVFVPGPGLAAMLTLVVLALPYAAFLGVRSLWQPYEPDLVETAREMRASGDYVVPTLNGKDYSEKPPLYYWSALAAASMRGALDETAARLPCALSALALCALTAAFGTRIFGFRAGLLAGLVLGTTPLCFQCGTAGMCDMQLALATTAGVMAVHAATTGPTPRGWLLVVAALCAGVGMMAKSLIAPAVIFLGTVPALALDRRRQLPSIGWWVLAVLVFVIASSPWYVLVYERKGWETVHDLLVRQTIGRFFGQDEAKGTIIKYFVSVPGDFLPWTIFVPAAALYARRVRTSDPERWRQVRFLLVGAAAEVAFLSCANCRINKYALPIFPFLALCLGAAFDDVAEGGAERTLVKVGSILFPVVVGITGVAVPFVVAWKVPTLVDATIPLATYLFLGGASLYVAARTLVPRGFAFTLAIFLAAGGALAEKTVVPAVDQIRSDRPIEAAITTFIKKDTPYASYRLYVRSFIIFYTERTYDVLRDQGELNRWLACVGPRTAYILARDEDVAPLVADAILGPRLKVVGRNPQGVGHDDYLLVRISP